MAPEPKTYVLLRGPLDGILADALGERVELPVEPGLSFGQGVGAAWAAWQHGAAEVYLVAPAAELQATLSPALADFAVRERLANLIVVAIAADEAAMRRADEVARELTLRGFIAETVGAHDPAQIAGALKRAQLRARPALLVCRAAGHAVLGAAGPPPPVPTRARTPIAVDPDGDARDAGAFAIGVALTGVYAPVGVVPLGDADGLKPALRVAARLRLPAVFLLPEDAHPADALWSLRLIAGLDVWRPADMHEAATVLEAAAGAARPTVIALGAEPDPIGVPLPSDLAAGAAIVADAAQPAVTLVATGAEVALALAARGALDIPVRVLAVPCVERFAAVSDPARRRLLGAGPTVVLEPGLAEPWRAIVGADALILTDPADLRLERVLVLLGLRKPVGRAATAALLQASPD